MKIDENEDYSFEKKIRQDTMQIQLKAFETDKENKK